MSKLLGKAKWGGYIYLLEYEGGSRLKVGYSANPRARIDTLRREADRYGLETNRVWVSRRHENYQANETAMIKWLSEVGELVGGDEHFAGVTYEDAKVRARTLTFEEVDDEVHERRAKEWEGMSIFEPLRGEVDSPKNHVRDMIAAFMGKQPDGTYRTPSPDDWYADQRVNREVRELLMAGGIWDEAKTWNYPQALGSVLKKMVEGEVLALTVHLVKTGGMEDLLAPAHEFYEDEDFYEE